MTDGEHLPPGQSAFAFPPLWPLGIVLKDNTVNVSGLPSKMVAFLGECQVVHETLFKLPLCVTSGNDGGHAPNSKHSRWKAVDLRALDLTSEAQLLFLMVLAYLSPSYGMAVFDERMLPGAAHFHIEEAG